MGDRLERGRYSREVAVSLKEIASRKLDANHLFHLVFDHVAQQIPFWPEKANLLSRTWVDEWSGAVLGLCYIIVSDLP